MAVLVKGTLHFEYTDDGHGDPVVLLPSSVSGNRQWRALTELLQDRYRVLAINLFGYGMPTPCPGSAPQSLYAQAQLVLALCEGLGELAYDLDNYGEARTNYEASLEVCREIGSRSLANLNLAGLANIACVQGDLRQARAF